jgi:Uma2 family endonuclease
MLTGWARSRDDLAVFADLKMRWGIPGLKNPGPDIAVVPGVRDKKRKRDSFDVMKEGTRPCLVIEVVSIGDAHSGERLLHGEQEQASRERLRRELAQRD